MSVDYLGDRIKASRKGVGLTQSELASKLDLANGTISAYEQGLKYPSLEALVKICQVLGTSSDYLLGLTNDLPLKMGGLTDEQMQPFLQLVAIVEQYNNLKNQT